MLNRLTLLPQPDLHGGPADHGDPAISRRCRPADAYGADKTTTMRMLPGRSTGQHGDEVTVAAQIIRYEHLTWPQRRLLEHA
jgi:hypothetical protein